MANGDGTHRLLSFNELGLLLRRKNVCLHREIVLFAKSVIKPVIGTFPRFLQDFLDAFFVGFQPAHNG